MAFGGDHIGIMQIPVAKAQSIDNAGVTDVNYILALIGHLEMSGSGASWGMDRRTAARCSYVVDRDPLTGDDGGGGGTSGVVALAGLLTWKTLLSP